MPRISSAVRPAKRLPAGARHGSWGGEAGGVGPAGGVAAAPEGVGDPLGSLAGKAFGAVMGVVDGPQNGVGECRHLPVGPHQLLLAQEGKGVVAVMGEEAFGLPLPRRFQHPLVTAPLGEVDQRPEVLHLLWGHSQRERWGRGGWRGKEAPEQGQTV